MTTKPRFEAQEYDGKFIIIRLDVVGRFVFKYAYSTFMDAVNVSRTLAENTTKLDYQDIANNYYPYPHMVEIELKMAPWKQGKVPDSFLIISAEMPE